MEKTIYRREHPDGSVEFFSDVPQKPQQVYYDDILQNRDGREALSLQMMQFGKEQSYPRRTIRNRLSPNFLLHYVTAGRGKFNGVVVESGQGFATFPDMPHTLEADPQEPWKFCWISFRGRDAYGILRQVGITPEVPVFSYAFPEQMDAVFEDLIYRTHRDADLSFYLVAKFYELMAYHRREYLEKNHEPSRQASYVQQAMNYMDAHYAEDVRMETMADGLHISRKYLCRLFSEYCGISPKEYLLQKRIVEAMRLLSVSEATIPEVARLVGYEDYTQLTRLFKSKKGISPQQYRQRIRQEQAETPIK